MRRSGVGGVRCLRVSLQCGICRISHVVEYFLLHCRSASWCSISGGGCFFIFVGEKVGGGEGGWPVSSKSARL